MKEKLLFIAALIAGLICSPSLARAAVSLPSVFGDQMVLQRELPIAVWGTDDVGQEVTVTLGSQSVSTTADASGEWRVDLDPESAGGPFTLTVTGSTTVSFDDVLVGEVWLCSGQSNMSFSLGNSDDWANEQLVADMPDLRLFRVSTVSSDLPLDDVTATGWRLSDASNASGFSAVCYYFGKGIREDLAIPVGLIQSSWGGTIIEAWTSEEALYSDPDVAAHCDAIAGNSDPNLPAVLYNGMIHGLIPYSLRGGIWYQGEANASRPWLYGKELPLLIEDWHARWGLDRFHFGVVQLPDYGTHHDQADITAGEAGWAWIRDAELRASRLVPDTGLATIIDTEIPDDIHPINKRYPGERLARWALHDAYGQTSILPSGPRYESYLIDGDSIELTFAHIGDGLRIDDGDSFKIAGTDGVFYWAQTEVLGDTVRVHSSDVPEPVAVRYAWDADPLVTFYNSDDLPASPFRTDYWPRSDYPSDELSPSAPTNLRAENVTDDTIDVLWDPADDDVGVCCYEIVVDGALQWHAAGLTAPLTGLTPGTTYSIEVRARDGADRTSEFAGPLEVTTTDSTAVPVIEVLGNDQVIADGDDTPSAEDGTDFGGVGVGGIEEHFFTIRNAGQGLLVLGGATPVALGGATSASFSLAAQPDTTTLAAGETTTFTVELVPSADATFEADVTIAYEGEEAESYEFVIQGYGALDPSDTQDGCGCVTPGRRPTMPWGLALGVALLIRRRMRRRSPGSARGQATGM